MNAGLAIATLSAVLAASCVLANILATWEQECKSASRHHQPGADSNGDGSDDGFAQPFFKPSSHFRRI